MDFRSLRVGFASVLLLSVALALGCSSGGNADGQAAQPGNDGGDCYPNQTCNAGLTCAAGRCSGPDERGAGGSNEVSSVGASKGDVELGEACADDKDCAAGLRCLAPLLLGTDRYCASPCAHPADCDALTAASYLIEVPLMANAQFGDPFTNEWNTTLLSRATACAPIGGKPGQPSFCQFGCPALSAATLDDKGQPNGCGCLPGYQTNANKTGCEKIPAQLGGCSVFGWASTEYREDLKQRYGIETDEPVCDACNSDMSDSDTLHCHTGQFMCALSSRSFHGHCIEVVSVDDLTACTNKAAYQSCDCNCPTPDACNNDNCACCVCTPSSTPTPRPVCKNPGGDGTGGSPGTGGSSAAGGAAVSGTAGASGVAGHASSGGASNGGAGGPSAAGAGPGAAGASSGTGGSVSASAGTGPSSAGAGHAAAGAGTGGAGGHAPP